MIPASDFGEVSRHWRLSASETPEYEIIRNDSVFRAGFQTSPVFEAQYRELQEMKSGLLERYRGYDVGEVFPGSTECNLEGSFFHISTEIDEDFTWPHPSFVRNHLMNNLSLIRGIGPVKEKLLKKRGYRTIEDLMHNKTFRADAEFCLEVIRYGSPGQVVSLARRWHPPSHPLVILSASLHGRENVLFADLETLGFFSRPIILFGLAGFRNENLVVSQYLVRDMEEELAALSETIGHVMEKPVLVSYNGKTFDLPYLVSRSAYYGASPVYSGFHIDLLHVARRLFRGTVQDCRLGTIERDILGIERGADIPGCFVPEFYEAYQQTGNPGPLIPVVEHNRSDIISLARFLVHVSGGSVIGG